MTGRPPLKRDDYDPSALVQRLRWRLREALGPAIYRMAEPELNLFFEYDVPDALIDAFSDAEHAYLKDIVARQSEASANMLAAALAGADLGRRSREELE